MREPLTKNFFRDEYHCTGCSKQEPCRSFQDTPMDIHFTMMIQELRNRCGFPIKINSGFRCQEWNDKQEGSAPESWHVQGLAVDIHCVDNIRRLAIVKHAIDIGFTDIGIAKTFIHLDNRPIIKQRIRVY